MRTLTDGTVFALPFVVTFAGWAISGWVLTKQLLPQFAANALQVQIGGVARGSVAGRLVHEAHALWYMAPLLPLAFLLAAIVAFRRRDAQPLAVVAIVGASQAFSLYAYLSGSIFPWFRFYIPAVPLEILLVGYVLSRPDRSVVTEEAERVLSQAIEKRVLGRPQVRVRGAMIAVVGALLALGVVAPSLPSSARAMLNSTVAPEETEDLGFVFHHTLTSEDKASKSDYSKIVSISRYIEKMHLANGSIIVDNTDPCVPQVILTSSNPRVFVIPNDRDFQRTLDAPLTFQPRHSDYVLEADPVGLSAHSVITLQYPGLYSGGQTWVTRIHTFAAGGLCPELRLFRVLRDPTGL
jgi:hypothetical protein